MTYRVRACLDLDAFRHNAETLKKLAPQSKLIAVVKANAYGHGIENAAPALNETVDGFAVATVDEGIALRRKGISAPVWILSDFDAQNDWLDVLSHELQPVLHCNEQLDYLLEQHDHATVHIKIETGMGRLGFPADQVSDVVGKIHDHPELEPGCLISHLASADQPDNPQTDAQLRLFDQSTAGHDLPRSLANSAGLIAHSATQLDYARPGISLYGVSPVSGVSSEIIDLRPVMTLKSHVLCLRHFEVGQTVGYGATFECQRPTTAAVIACGYGDGYPRHAPNGTPVLFNGRRVPIIGRISMDSLVVDVTDVEAPSIDDEVILWGRGLPVEEVAEQCDTIAYELFCRLTGRVRYETNHGN